MDFYWPQRNRNGVYLGIWQHIGLSGKLDASANPNWRDLATVLVMQKRYYHAASVDAQFFRRLRPQERQSFMCLLIFAHQPDCRYPLVLAANRDEFHARPTAASAFWEDYPDLLAGRDLAQGGTWMGITRGGRFAAITNYRDPSHTAPAPRSRGELPLAFLTGDQHPRDYLQDLLACAGEYAGFNLLVGTAGELWYLTNSRQASKRTPQSLQPGIYGLSNAQLDTAWPKVTLGKHKLKNLLDQDALDHDRLALVVGDRQLADLKELRRHSLHSDMDQTLSAQFITTASYGTRCSTTLWMERGVRKTLAHWRETSFDSRGIAVQQQEESVALI